MNLVVLSGFTLFSTEMFYWKISDSKDGIEGFIAPWELSVSWSPDPVAFTPGTSQRAGHVMGLKLHRVMEK